MKVMVVEDDDTLLRATMRTLRGGGHTVVSAQDAVAAVSVARQQEPDLVLLDLGLPAGGGVVVLQRLRMLAATSLTPVIVVTGGATYDQQLALEAAGVDAILTKPVPADALLAAVDAALGTD